MFEELYLSLGNLVDKLIFDESENESCTSNNYEFELMIETARINEKISNSKNWFKQIFAEQSFSLIDASEKISIKNCLFKETYINTERKLNVKLEEYKNQSIKLEDNLNKFRIEKKRLKSSIKLLEEEYNRLVKKVKEVDIISPYDKMVYILDKKNNLKPNMEVYNYSSDSEKYYYSSTSTDSKEF